MPPWAPFVIADDGWGSAMRKVGIWFKLFEDPRTFMEDYAAAIEAEKMLQTLHAIVRFLGEVRTNRLAWVVA